MKEKGISPPPPAVFDQAHQAKTADPTKANPVTKLKADQITVSTRGAMAETPMPILYKKSFKKSPHWDFDDVYNQDAPPRQTVSKLSQDRT